MSSDDKPSIFDHVNERSADKFLLDLHGVLEAYGAKVDPETPRRMMDAMAELANGYRQDPAEHLKLFPVAEDPGIVVVRQMPFASLCEHHVLPFTGLADIVYLPQRAAGPLSYGECGELGSDLDGPFQIIGLSKLPRILHVFARRLQTQERIGQQVADFLMGSKLRPRGVMVRLRANHTCMSLRGVRSPGETVTSCVRGVFADDSTARAEALELMKG